MPDKPQQSRVPPPIKPQITADNEDGSEAPGSEAHERDMETNDGEEIVFVNTLHRVLGVIEWHFPISFTLKIMKVPR